MSKVQAAMTNEIPSSNVQNPNGTLDSGVEKSGQRHIGLWELGIHWTLSFGHWTFGCSFAAASEGD